MVEKTEMLAYIINPLKRFALNILGDSYENPCTHRALRA